MQEFSMPFYSSCLAPPAVTLRLHPSVSPSPVVYTSPSLFGSLLLPFTLCLCSPDSLLQLLVFVFASQSCASHSYCSLCFLPTLFSTSLQLSFVVVTRFLPHSVRTCAFMWGECEGGDSRGWSEYLRVCTYELVSHTLTRYLTCDLYCTSQK